MASRFDTIQAGSLIGDRHKVIRLLGQGGMGAVYEAENTWTGRRVAIKVLHPAFSTDPISVARFRGEAQAATQLAHPNIIDVLDMGADAQSGALYIVQELLRGEQACGDRVVDGRSALRDDRRSGSLRRALDEPDHDEDPDVAPPRLQDVAPRVDAGVAAIVGRAMETDVGMRDPTMRAMLDDVLGCSGFQSSQREANLRDRFARSIEHQPPPDSPPESAGGAATMLAPPAASSPGGSQPAPSTPPTAPTPIDVIARSTQQSWENRRPGSIVQAPRRALMAVVAMLIAAWIAAGCSPVPQTEIVVLVSTNFERGRELHSVRVTAQRSGATAPLHDRLYDLTDLRFPVPGEVVLVAKDPDDSRPLSVRVTGELEGRTLQQDAVVRFQSEHTIYLQMTLARECTNLSCAVGLTCRLGVCERPDQASVITSVPPMQLRYDGGASVDQPSIDVQGADKPVPDAPPIDAAGPDVPLDRGDDVGTDVLDAGTDIGMDVLDAGNDVGMDVGAESGADVPDAGVDADSDIVDGSATDVGTDAATRWPRVGVGNDFSCALRSASDLRCWGSDREGEHGNGADPLTAGIATVSGITDGIELDGEGGHMCLRAASGYVWCWGGNDFGLLGVGDEIRRDRPTLVGGGIADAVSVATGLFHSCVARASGTVTCWGQNTYGQLGGTPVSAGQPPRDVPGLTDAVEVAAGGTHSCARRAGGTVVCWGRNQYGQLGIGTFTPTTTAPPTTPVQVMGITDAVELASNGDFTCARRMSGAVSCWGSNGDGQLGDGSRSNRATPVAVTMLGDAVALTAGTYHACVVSSAGGVRCWGENSAGQLGDDSMNDSTTPVAVFGLTDVVDVAAGSSGAQPGSSSHTCAAQRSGGVWCWGRNLNGQTAPLSTTVYRRPVLVTLP